MTDKSWDLNLRGGSPGCIAAGSIIAGTPLWVSRRGSLKSVRKSREPALVRLALLAQEEARRK